MKTNRDTFVVFHVTRQQARMIRETIHAQSWYDGADIPISQREKTLYGTRIPVQAVNMALENLFGQLANWIKKGQRK